MRVPWKSSALGDCAVRGGSAKAAPASRKARMNRIYRLSRTASHGHCVKVESSINAMIWRVRPEFNTADGIAHIGGKQAGSSRGIRDDDAGLIQDEGQTSGVANPPVSQQYKLMGSIGWR